MIKSDGEQISDFQELGMVGEEGVQYVNVPVNLYSLMKTEDTLHFQFPTIKNASKIIPYTCSLIKDTCN